MRWRNSNEENGGGGGGPKQVAGLLGTNHPTDNHHHPPARCCPLGTYTHGTNWMVLYSAHPKPTQAALSTETHSCWPIIPCPPLSPPLSLHPCRAAGTARRAARESNLASCRVAAQTAGLLLPSPISSLVPDTRNSYEGRAWQEITRTIHA